MNWDRIKGYWMRFKGNARQEMDKLSGGQRGEIGEKRGRPAGKILETYGAYQKEVEKHISAWQARRKKTERSE